MNISKHAFFTALIVFLVAIGISTVTYKALKDFSTKTIFEEELRLQKSIEKVTIQAFSLEGAYPPSLAYLEANYGLILDTKNYAFHYMVLGANIKPEIVVKSLLIPNKNDPFSSTDPIYVVP